MNEQMPQTQPNIQANYPQNTAPQIQPKNNMTMVIVVGVLMLIIGVLGGMLISSNKPEITQNITPTLPPTQMDQPTIEPTNIPTSALKPTTNPLSDWKKYSNTTLGFSVSYPTKISAYNEVWQYEELSFDQNTKNVSFGTPSSKSGGYIWGINVYTSATLDNLIKDMGKQFADRKESRKNITINGISAVLVTVTTNEVSNWVYKAVFIQNTGKIYQINNGAVELPEYETFYNSFKLL